MPISSAYAQDQNTNGSTLSSITTRVSGLTSNQWVIVYAVLAVLILFTVPRVFKGVK